MYRFILTCGDINGIGPEISLKVIEKIRIPKNEEYIFICPGNIFLELYKSLNLTFKYEIVENSEKIPNSNGKIIILSLPHVKAEYGKPTVKSGEVSYIALLKAKDLLNQNSALITAPISKKALKMSGIKFPGHTEMISDWYNIKNYCMMFLSDRFRCGLVTIHEAIREVPKLLTKKRIYSVINTVNESLQNDFGILSPKLAVLGLNPHAGESGKIGTEEIDTIIPVVQEFKSGNVVGPFVPDAYFANRSFLDYDCTIGMYHDQLLIPFKLLNFEKGVNFTAGLPIVRTSPDHGTAFDIAGTNSASSQSMIEAYKWARKILKKRKQKM